jgi:cysteine desulfurase
VFSFARPDHVFCAVVEGRGRAKQPCCHTQKNEYNTLMKLPIYLDYAATTPVDPRVAEKMLRYLTSEGGFANPASTHTFGQAARAAVEHAREQLADLINAEPSELIWTSGATESNNLALKGAARLYQSKGKHIVTVKTEHPSVLDCCQQLEKEGFLVTYLTPQTTGLLDLDQLRAALRPDTIMVSVMQVNNEIGIIQDIAAIATLTAERGILLHVDAAQSLGKIPINVQQVPVDLISFCAHKVYGPKGIGALYVRKKPRVRVAPLIQGGGHEQGMRSGTLATHQIVGMGEAVALAKQQMADELNFLTQLRQRFWQEISEIAAISINGDFAHSYPGILNICFPSRPALKIMAALPELAISAGSACQSKVGEPSYVLRALGLNTELAGSSIRFSFGRFTTQDEVDFAVQQVKKAKFSDL